jgi:CyaY protein
MSPTLSEPLFEQIAERTLRALASTLDTLEGLEADLESGILTLEFEDGAKYVLNSHRAARQIWMAAESRAWHFDATGDLGASSEPRTSAPLWTSTKGGEELWDTLEAVLARKLARPIRLARS